MHVFFHLLILNGGDLLNQAIYIDFHIIVGCAEIFTICLFLCGIGLRDIFHSSGIPSDVECEAASCDCIIATLRYLINLNNFLL